jgi:hypothetical protein
MVEFVVVLLKETNLVMKTKARADSANQRPKCVAIALPTNSCGSRNGYNYAKCAPARPAPDVLPPHELRIVDNYA